MYYMEKMQDWCDELSYLFSWKTKEGDPIKNLYKLLGVSRTSHLDMLYKSSPVPDYIRSQIEVYDLLTPLTMHKRAFEKLADKDLGLTDISERVIKAWCILTGYELDFDGRIPMYAGQMRLQSVNEIIRDVREADPSGLGVCLLIEHYAKRYMADFDIKISMDGKVLGKNNALVTNKAKLDCILSYPNARRPMDDFKAKCESVVSFYKENAKLNRSLDDDGDLIDFELMLKAKNDLATYQRFLISNKGNLGGKMQLHQDIFYYNRVKDLIDSTIMMPNGFSLALIRKPTVSDSYFVLVVKKDTEIFLITEKKGSIGTVEPSFGEKHSYDSNTYGFERYRSSMFPHHLVSRLGVSSHSRESESKALAATQNNLLGQFSELTNSQILWVNFMFEELKNESGNLSGLPKLALANEIPHPMLEAPKEKANLPVGYNENMTIDVKSSPSVSRKMIESIYPKLNGEMRLNDWMESLFQSEIDESTLYIPSSVRSKNELFLIGSDSKLSKGALSKQSEDYFDNERLKKSSVGFSVLSDIELGDAEGIQRQADIKARRNKALVLSRLVRQDFAENKGKIIKWVAGKIAKNLPNLLGTLVSQDHAALFNYDELYDLPDHITTSITVDYRQIHFKKLSFDERYIDTTRIKNPSFLESAFKVRTKTQKTTKCAMTKESDSNCRFILRVANVFDLVKVTGIERSKLPVQLRNYGLVNERSSDAVEKISNPWNKLDFTTVIPLSCDVVSNKRKEMGLSSSMPSQANFYDSIEEFSRYQEYCSLNSDSYNKLRERANPRKYLGCDIDFAQTTTFAFTKNGGF